MCCVAGTVELSRIVRGSVLSVCAEKGAGKCFNYVVVSTTRDRIGIGFGFNPLGLDIFRALICVDGLRLTDWGRIIGLKQVV